jgi:hypothetical protein
MRFVPFLHRAEDPGLGTSGLAEIFDMIRTYDSLFAAVGVELLPFTQGVGNLRGRGFADGTILINLSWLVQDRYAPLDVEAGAPIIRRPQR